MKILEGKKGVIFGVANKHSLAWSIAVHAKEHGAELLLGVASERFRDKVAPMAEQLGVPVPIVCDVTDDDSIAAAFAAIAEAMPRLDFLVHAIAFARREELEGRFVETSREGFHIAQDISSYSLLALAQAAEPFLAPGASLITLSYLGSVRAVPAYNVMGVAKASLEATVRYLASDLGPKSIRVNTLSAGPIKTLSSSAVRGLKERLELQPLFTPLRRSPTGDDVGKAAVFLLSDLASGVTGDCLYVDCGFHSIGNVP